MSGIDYTREKYALVKLAEWLESDAGGRWATYLSVDPDSLGRETLVFVERPVIDVARHEADPRYKYTFYTDRGGRIDLVAKRAGVTMLIEGKGGSANPVAGLEAIVGRGVLTMGAEPNATLEYGICIPDTARWTDQLARGRHPVLRRIHVFLVAENGEVRRGDWPNAALGN
jgi:hypothetical protein